MLTPEERKVLEYLRNRGGAPVEDVVRACLPGSAPGWADRVVGNLDWLGYVTVVPGGASGYVQITAAGLAKAGGGAATVR
jgi:hypothetical protein